MTIVTTQIRKNSLFYFLSQTIRLLTNFLLFIGIARFYGPEAFGQFTTAHTFSLIFLLFADFGFDALLTTAIARHREHATELAQRYYSLKVLFAIFASLSMILISNLQTFSSTTKILINIFSVFVLFSSLNNFFFAIFKGFEKYQYETKISLLINSIFLISLIIIGIFKIELYIIAIIFVISRILGLLLAVRTANSLIKFNIFYLTFRNWKEIWYIVIIFGLHYLFGNLFFLIDTILLSIWKGDYDVGIYQSVFKIIVFVLIIPDIAINTLLPVLSRLNVDNINIWASLGRLLNKTLLLIAFPISMILFIFADSIINLLYGPGLFSEAIPILRIFAIIVLIRFSVETYALMLTTAQRQRTRMLIVLFGTILNILLNYYAIPTYGPVGAAVVSLITNLFVGICYIVSTKSFFLKWTFNLNIILPFFIAMILSLILWQIHSLSFFFTIPIFIVIYGLVFYFIGFTKTERNLIFHSNKNIESTF